MKIVKILGGLGNQMFQFALYEALRQKHPDERVLIDLHCFKGYHKHRGFELPKVFGISYEEASWTNIARLAYPYPNFQCWRIGSRLLPARKSMLCEKADFTFEPTALTRPGDTYYDGYWQHEEYFKHIRQEILDTYRFPTPTDQQNLNCQSLITGSNSCSIHIRRGDYLTDPLRKGTTDTNYVPLAIQRMKDIANPELWCVFSDDPAWTRRHLERILPQHQTLFVDWNKNELCFYDMYLMTLCQHHIIANSSFSWWGAWLSTRQDKTIIAPRQWMNMKDVCSPVPQGWLKL